MNYELQRYLYYKTAELQFQDSHNNELLKEVGLSNDARIKAIQEIHSAEMTNMNSKLRYIASSRKPDKKA